LEELVGKGGGACSGDGERAEAEFQKKLTAVDVVGVRGFVFVCHVSVCVVPTGLAPCYTFRPGSSAPGFHIPPLSRLESGAACSPVHFCNPAPIAATEINPVASAGMKLYDSIVMVPTGQRMAQRPQRMQRVSSFSMAEPVTTPNSSAVMSSSSTPKHSWLSRMCCTVSGSNSMRFSETSSRQFSGQTSTQPPHR